MDDIVFDKDCVCEFELVLEGRLFFICFWNISIIGECKLDQIKKLEFIDIYLVFVCIWGFCFIELFKILLKDSIGQRFIKEDFVWGMKKLNVLMYDFKLRELFDMMDVNKNGVIVFQEFVLWICEWY